VSSWRVPPGVESGPLASVANVLPHSDPLLSYSVIVVWQENRNILAIRDSNTGIPKTGNNNTGNTARFFNTEIPVLRRPNTELFGIGVAHNNSTLKRVKLVK